MKTGSVLKNAGQWLLSLSTKRRLTRAEQEILRHAAVDGTMRIHKKSDMPGEWVTSGKKDFRGDLSDFTFRARYREAFERLFVRRLVRFDSGNLYRLTDSGFKVARRLASAAKERH